MTRRQFFKFKKFEVKQTQTAMKIGTDGVLLGAWAAIENAKNILDVGTGTGLIALMSAQRNPHANITAIEIEPKAAEEAAYNFKHSPWHDRLKIIQSDFIQTSFPNQFDAIICNPPFFSKGIEPTDIPRKLARHTVSLSLDKLVHNAAKLLSKKGNLFMIIATEQQNHLTAILKNESLYIQKLCLVKGHANTIAKRILVQIGRKKRPIEQNELIIEKKRHVYTMEYIALTKDFYLKM